MKALLHEQLREHLEALEALVATEVQALNEMLRARGMLIIADGGRINRFLCSRTAAVPEGSKLVFDMGCKEPRTRGARGART